jgi:hypothetical protein
MESNTDVDLYANTDNTVDTDMQEPSRSRVIDYNRLTGENINESDILSGGLHVDVFRPRSQKDNLCLFFACYNALRTDEERMVFSFNNPENPALEYTRLRIENNGYDASDMMAYLRHLESNRMIKAWAFHRKKMAFHNRKYSSGNGNQHTACVEAFLCRRDVKFANNKYIVFGSSMNKEKIQDTLSRATRVAVKKDEPVFSAQLSASEKFPKATKNNSSGHAISVVWDPKGIPHLYDSGLFKVKLATLESLFLSVAHIHSVYVFKLVL